MVNNQTTRVFRSRRMEGGNSGLSLACFRLNGKEYSGDGLPLKLRSADRHYDVHTTSFDRSIARMFGGKPLILAPNRPRTRVPRRFDVETTSGRIIRETIAMAFGGRDGSRTRSGKGRLVRDTFGAKFKKGKEIVPHQSKDTETGILVSEREPHTHQSNGNLVYRTTELDPGACLFRVDGDCFIIPSSPILEWICRVDPSSIVALVSHTHGLALLTNNFSQGLKSQTAQAKAPALSLFHFLPRQNAQRTSLIS
ncbi:hypothetical protein AAG906_034051 [Vitis piasezkii]